MRKLRLWIVSESSAAYLYSKLPPERHREQGDQFWIPKSLVEHRTKWSANEHEVTVPEWFADAKGL